MSDAQLEFRYEQSPTVRKLKARLIACCKGISLEFERYSEEHTRGPGLYFAIASGRSVAPFAEPMGSNAWPIDTAAHAGDDCDAFYTAASAVARSCDGGVCLGVDGTILEQMVRFRSVRDDELPDGVSVSGLEYADWMGARHMSAVEISLRPEVLATVTLSEETGRVTAFDGGRYVTTSREELGSPWREDDA